MSRLENRDRKIGVLIKVLWLNINNIWADNLANYIRISTMAFMDEWFYFKYANVFTISYLGLRLMKSRKNAVWLAPSG